MLRYICKIIKFEIHLIDNNKKRVARKFEIHLKKHIHCFSFLCTRLCCLRFLFLEQRKCIKLCFAFNILFPFLTSLVMIINTLVNVVALGVQYFLPNAFRKANKLLEEAILEADRKGVKVLTLGALNKVRDLSI